MRLHHAHDGPRLSVDLTRRVDFYVLSVWRVRKVAERTIDLPQSTSVRTALSAFDQHWPGLDNLRDDILYPREPEGVWHLRTWTKEGIVQLTARGTPFVVSVRSMTPHVEALHRALADFLGDPDEGR